MLYTTTGLYVLVIDENPEVASSESVVWNDLLKSGPYQITTLLEAARIVQSNVSPDVILTRLGSDNENSLERIAILAHSAPLIAVVPFERKDLAVRAMSLGFSDYLFSEDLNPSGIYKSIGYSIERHSMQLRLHESDQKYRELFHRSPNAIFIYDMESLEILEANQMALDIFEYDRKEVEGMSLYDLHTPEEIAALREESRKQLSRNVYQCRTKNGKTFQAEAQGSSVVFNEKEARLVVLSDLSERNAYENAIRANENRFRKLIDAGGDLIGIMSPEGPLTYVSPNHTNVMGWSQEELMKHTLESLIHKDDWEMVVGFYSALPQRGSSTSSPYRILKADGSYITIETIMTNMVGDPDINGYVLNSRDITARVLSEQKIKENQERFVAISNATSDAIYDFDYASNTLTFGGSGYNAIIGQKLRNQSADYSFFESSIHEEDKDRVIRFMESAAKSRKRNHFEIEYRFGKKDGSFVHILDRFEIIRQNGSPVKRIGAMQDISARKFQENILNFEKEIYQANANPKTGFQGAVQLMTQSLTQMIPGSSCTLLSLDEIGKIRPLAGSTPASRYCQPLYDKFAKESTDNPVGMVLSTGKRIIVQDFRTDEQWSGLSARTEECGIRAGWFIPVRRTSGKMIGLIMISFSKDRIPNSQEITVSERASNLLGILFDSYFSHLETERAKERYDIVAKATSDTIWDWNIKEDKFEWNKGIRGVFGYKQADIGHTSSWWFDKIHPEDTIRMSVKLYSFIEQKTEKWQDEYRFACADGTYRYVYDRAFLVKDAQGNSIRMIGAMQDITKQKQEEQRLKLLETVITQMKDAVIITESGKSTDKIPKIVFVNPAFTAMTGYQPHEVIGKRPTAFLNRKAIHPYVRKMMQALHNKQEFKFETLNLRKDGEEYWINFSMIPITNKEGKHSHWISIQRDITEEKRQEREKEQLIRELTQNNKDLKQFSYITSHNLRAPLSNLTGLMNLLEDIPIENPELQEILNGFHKSTHLLNETINDLVKVVIIKDSPSIQKEEVLIKDVFENVFSQLNFMISMYRPIIKLQLERVSILNINKAYLESILLNLLTNAIKYRSADRRLRIFISSKMVNDSIQLIFKDNGIGIDLERNRDKIFGLYQRFHNYPDSKGLGLYLVKSQVESMGGQIAVESAVDKGTTFTITFKKQT